IGARPEYDGERWDAAARVIQQALGAIGNATNLASNPEFVQTPARVPVANVSLDAKALTALQRLDDYVHAFRAWIRLDAAVTIAPEQRLATFDHAYRATNGPGQVATSGAKIVAMLPPGAMKVVANFDALLARGKRGDDIAEQLATA